MIYSLRDSGHSAATDTHKRCYPFLEPGELSLKPPHSSLLLPNNLLSVLILLDLLIQNVLHTLHLGPKFRSFRIENPLERQKNVCKEHQTCMTSKHITQISTRQGKKDNNLHLSKVQG
jgi:hypothetical protein